MLLMMPSPSDPSSTLAEEEAEAQSAKRTVNAALDPSPESRTFLSLQPSDSVKQRATSSTTDVVNSWLSGMLGERRSLAFPTKSRRDREDEVLPDDLVHSAMN